MECTNEQIMHLLEIRTRSNKLTNIENKKRQQGTHKVTLIKAI